MEKYNGIDERKIKCCDTSKDTIQAGISFEQLADKTNVLRFHYLDYITRDVLDQRTKTMYLNKENTQQLIKELKKMKFK